MQEYSITGVAYESITQYTLVKANTSYNEGVSVATANARVLGVAQKTVAGTSTVPVAVSVQTVGTTWVKLASGQSVVNGDPLKAIDSSGNAGKAATSTDNVFGYARQSATGPCVINVALDIQSSYK